MKSIALFMLAATLFAQPNPIPSRWAAAPAAARRGAGLPIPNALARDFNNPQTPTVAAKSFFRSRLFLVLMGGALAGTGAALLTTGEGSREVPASNCSFYPAPFVPCIPAHTEKTRNGVRDGFGGGMLVGGFVVVFVAIGP